jgi:hypothetical protein
LEARIELPTLGDPVYLSNIITGGGYHAYTFTAKESTIIEIHVFPGFGVDTKSLSPVLTDPTGQLLTPDDNYSEWVGKAPFTGIYKLSIDSNFKGLDYAFVIRAISLD